MVLNSTDKRSTLGVHKSEGTVEKFIIQISIIQKLGKIKKLKH